MALISVANTSASRSRPKNRERQRVISRKLLLLIRATKPAACLANFVIFVAMFLSPHVINICKIATTRLFLARLASVAGRGGYPPVQYDRERTRQSPQHGVVGWPYHYKCLDRYNSNSFVPGFFNSSFFFCCGLF